MPVKARKHVRNEGSRRFKSAPLRQPYMDPARVQGLKCRRDLELGCSHISGLACGASDEALGLDGFPHASFRYQSGGLAGHGWRQSWEAPVRPVHHQRHTTHPTQPLQERFSVPHQSSITRDFAPRALLTAGGEPGRKTADLILLAER
jgi:hypothetical protein